MIDTDKDWEEFARQDAYFSVLTRPEFAKIAGNPEARARFFQSGETHVDQIMRALEAGGVTRHEAWETLDFGCGVGRVLVPLAKKCLHATGVDVSSTMRSEAEKNLNSFGILNASVCTLEEIPPGQTFDLIHSYIVFQHIPVTRGLDLLRRLLQMLKPEGCVALHFSFARTYAHSEAGWKLASRMPGSIPLLRLLKGSNPFERRMLMMRYDLNSVFAALHAAGFTRLQVDVVDEAGNLGALIVGRRRQTNDGTAL